MLSNWECIENLDRITWRITHSSVVIGLVYTSVTDSKIYYYCVNHVTKQSWTQECASIEDAKTKLIHLLVDFTLPSGRYIHATKHRPSYESTYPRRSERYASRSRE